VGLAFVPPAWGGTTPLRGVLLLHGAGARARQGLDLLADVAEEEQLLLLAPKSVGRTWDVIVDGFGADVARIDALLEVVANRYPINRLTFAGFSDGASYALTLALGNGDVADSAIALSPGFAAPLLQRGRPRIFISHGSDDPVLPVDRCSRRLVPQLRRAGYDVVYHEFPGGHRVPPEVVEQALKWLRQGAA
jgi:predicted esterase